MNFIFLDTKYFFDKLPGDIYLRLFPNAEHEMILHGLSSPHVIYSKLMSLPRNSPNQNNSFDLDLFSDTQTLRIQCEYTRTHFAGGAKEVRIKRVILITV